MTLQLYIKPELESKLLEKAQLNGLRIEDFIESVLERETTAIDPTASSSLTGREKAEAFCKWASSFPPDLPRLSLEDVSRERIYSRD